VPPPSLQFAAFSRDLIVGLFGDPSQPNQDAAVEYLASYLGDLGAKSALFEPHYVDRHYVDDFANYYSRSFRPPRAHCARVHFFSSPEAAIGSFFDEAYAVSSNAKKVAQSLEEFYLGFVVQRPLATAKIGRTVLKTYPLAGGRHYQVLRPYRINLAGLRLHIQGLAYQQQDRGAAVCASTALWSALQRVAYVAGHRTPTPISITEAAASPFPASYGLNDLQMAAAIAALGYSADEFMPAENRALFMAKLQMCLDSQLPAILLVSKKQKTGAGEVTIGHAVTVTGYNESSSPVDVPAPDSRLPPVPMLGGNLETLYVHDDNLGSHAHYELVKSADLNNDGHPKLILRRGSSKRPVEKWWDIDDWAIECALVPKPQKLRQPIDALFLNILMLRWLFEGILKGEPGLLFSAWYSSGVDYRGGLLEDPSLDRGQFKEFNFSLSLPRHIGVIRARTVSHKLCDFVLDVTEIDRQPTKPAVLALVGYGTPRGSQAWADLQKVALYFGGVPTISAPPTP
jgi:hypothetical protein